jgi:hypothetical protein
MTVAIQVAALMEAAMYHAKSKEINGHRQDNQKHKLCNLEPERYFPCRGGRLRISYHLFDLLARSREYMVLIRIRFVISRVAFGVYRSSIVAPKECPRRRLQANGFAATSAARPIALSRNLRRSASIPNVSTPDYFVAF